MVTETVFRQELRPALTEGAEAMDRLTPKARREAAWRCPDCDHRFTEFGCPVCRGLATRNDPDKPTLVDELPEVAEQWHPTKNGKLSPRDVNMWSKRRALA